MLTAYWTQGHSHTKVGGAAMEKNKTDIAVVGIGTLVSTIGAATLNKSRLGAGILGFGLAHIALGLLDMARNKYRF